MTGGSRGREETNSSSSGLHILPGTAAGDCTSGSGAAITTSSPFSIRLNRRPALLHGKPAPPLPVLLARKWEGRAVCALGSRWVRNGCTVRSAAPQQYPSASPSSPPPAEKPRVLNYLALPSEDTHSLASILSCVLYSLRTYFVSGPVPGIAGVCGEEAQRLEGPQGSSVPVDSRQCDELYSRCGRAVDAENRSIT